MVEAVEENIEEVVEIANSLESLEVGEKVEILEETSKYEDLIDGEVEVQAVGTPAVGAEVIEEVIEETSYGVNTLNGVPLPAGL